MQSLKAPFQSSDSPVLQVAADGSQDYELMPIAFSVDDRRLHWADRIHMPTRLTTHVFRPKDHFQTSLELELLLPGLNRVHHYLWWCSLRRAPALALHEQIMQQRGVTVTERIGLHLICPDGRIFLKPMSQFLLDRGFWDRCIVQNPELYGCAAGFLLSYTWLVQHESDLEIAKQHNLMPAFMTWESWRLFATSILSNLEQVPTTCINKRYQFGEISLPSLNAVYRYSPETRRYHYLSGYLYGYGQFAAFWRRNFAWLGLGFLYMTAILTAMQVGLAVPYIAGNGQFQGASYGFAVTCIVIPVAIVVRFTFTHLIWLLRFSLGWMRRE